MAYPKIKAESYELFGGINSKASIYLNGPNEFRDLSNLNFASPGALSKRPGTALYAGATVSGRITGGIEFERLSGASYIVVSANTNAYTVTPSSFTAFKTGLLNNAVLDFITFVDRLFGANGQDFFKFDGTNVSNYSLPNGASGWGATASAGGSLTAGVTGVFVVSWGYLNDRGYYGPPAPGITITVTGSGTNSIAYYGLTTPSGFGISAIALYRTSAGGVDLVGTTLASAAATTVTDTGFTLTTRTAPTYLYSTLIPRYLEIYNNQLFMAGFSSLLSTVVWSDIGEPEGVEPEFNAEFRTNDGDRVTGLKAYNGALVVTKERSFHTITGDNPDNFLLREITDQYGCLSNNAMVAFEDNLWFLDTKGIVEFNGANVRIVSNKVEPIFSSMNIEAARDNATAIHNRQANEVWFSIPINGATMNNCVVVYDYLADGWTKYDGLNASTLFVAKGALSIKGPFFGNYSGNLSYFGSTLYGDNGAAITCMADARFFSQRGQTVENMYRRFYLDVDPVLGVTQAITVNFRTNFGSTIVLTRTMYQAPFQSRIDFGLSAKSIQPEIFHTSASLPFKMNGFSFEGRFQRDT